MSIVTEEVIRSLAGFRGQKAPVTSCYLDVDGRRYRRHQDYEHELDVLLREGRAKADGDRSVESDLRRIEDYVRGGLDRSNTRGLAFFACAAHDLWEVIPLPVPVRNRVVVNRIPAVGQLEAVVTENRRLGVLLADKQRARVFVFELGELIEQSETIDELPRDYDARGDMERGDVQHHVDALAHQHLRHAADAAWRMFQDHGFDYLAIGAPDEIANAVEGLLHPYLQQRLCGRVSVPVTASPSDIKAAALDVEAAADRRRQAELVDRLREAVATGRRGAAGLRKVLEAVNLRRVDRLVVSDGYEESGWRCDVMQRPGPGRPPVRRVRRGHGGRSTTSSRRRSRRRCARSAGSRSARAMPISTCSAASVPSSGTEPHVRAAVADRRRRRRRRDQDPGRRGRGRRPAGRWAIRCGSATPKLDAGDPGRRGRRRRRTGRGRRTAEPVAAVGVGLPGLVDAVRALWPWGRTFPGIRNHPFAPSSPSGSRRPVAVDNDAACAAWAEHRRRGRPGRIRSGDGHAGHRHRRGHRRRGSPAAWRQRLRGRAGPHGRRPQRPAVSVRTARLLGAVRLGQRARRGWPAAEPAEEVVAARSRRRRRGGRGAAPVRVVVRARAWPTSWPSSTPRSWSSAGVWSRRARCCSTPLRQAYVDLVMAGDVRPRGAASLPGGRSVRRANADRRRPARRLRSGRSGAAVAAFAGGLDLGQRRGDALEAAGARLLVGLDHLVDVEEVLDLGPHHLGHVARCRPPGPTAGRRTGRR